MALARWFDDRSTNDLWRLSRDFQRLFNDFGLDSGPIARTSGVYPALNIYDDGESIIARAEVAGVDPKDIGVTVTQDTLTIRGERKSEETSEGVSFHRRETQSGTFSRSVTLPEHVNSEKVVANCNNGVLEVRMPRAENAKPRKVTVN